MQFLLNVDGTGKRVRGHAELRKYGVTRVVHDAAAVPLDGLGKKVEAGRERSVSAGLVFAG